MINTLKPYITILLFVLVNWPVLIYARQVDNLKIQHFDQKSGLEFITITDIKQDQLGFIWLASQDGLSRFDGYSFLTYRKNFNDPSSLMDNFIWQINLNKDHSLWLATRTGFTHYEPLTETFDNHTIESANNKEIVVSAILPYKKDQIIIGTAGSGLFQYQKSNNKISPINSSPLSQNNFINVLFHDEADTGIWIGSGTNYISNQGESGLQFYLPDEKIIKSFPVPFKSGINSILAADKDYLWIGTFGDGLWKFNKKQHSFSPGPDIADSFIHTLLKDKKNGLWIGTNSGLYLLKSGKVHPFMPNARKGEGPGNRLIKSLFLDRSENLWIGTWTDGLFKVNLMENGFHKLSQGNNEETLSGNVIPAVTQYQNDLWVAEWKNGIEKFSASGKKIRHYQHLEKQKKSLTGGYIRQLHVDKKNNLWIGSTNGLDLFQPATDNFKHFMPGKGDINSLCGNLILNLSSDNQGLWIGTRGSGACFLAYGSDKFKSYRHNPADDNSISHNNVSVILADPPFGIWFGTEGGGLNFLNTQTHKFTHYNYSASNTPGTTPHNLTHNNISALMLDNNQTLWIGTQGGGINRFHFNKNTRTVSKIDYISTADGLSSDAIAGIVEGDDGNIWIGTTHGITSLNKSGHMAYYEADDIYFIGSQYKNSQGDIYFGSAYGLRYFNPDNIKLNPYKIPVAFTKFRLNNKTIKPGENSLLKQSITLSFKLTIPHDQNMFTIEFAGLDFQDPASNKYKYRLQGFDKDWIEANASQRFATYTNIPAGEYRLKVIAANNAGLWNEQGRSLKIKIETSPWASNWAFTLYSLLIFALFTYLAWEYRQREELNEQYDQELKKKEQRLLLSLWGSGNELWDWDMITGEVVSSNELDLLTLPKNLLNGSRNALMDYIHEKDVHRVNHAYLLHRTNRSPIFECNYRIKDTDGHWVWVLDKGKIVEWDALGNPIRMSGTLENINNIKSTEERLKIIAKSLEKTTDGIWITDENFNFVFVNESFLNLSGLSREELYQSEFHFRNIGNQNLNFENHVKQYLRTEGRWQGEIWDITAEGKDYQQQLNIDSIRDEEGIITHYIGVFSDISHRKSTEKKLRNLIKNDRLTGLLNYTHFLQVTENIINQRENNKPLNFAIIFISIDGFKFINEHFGLDIGDKLLIAFAKRLEKISQSADALSRFGGDDFVILKENINDSSISSYLTQLRLTLTKPYNLSGHEIIITTSCGFAFYPEHGKLANELFANSHAALNQIKQNSGDGIQKFNEIIRSRSSISQQLDIELRHAISNNELELFFQPRIHLATGNIDTIETSLRWNSPRRGVIPPNNFLPIAEKTGLIFPIGKWVIQTLFKTLHDWRDLLGNHNFGLHISIEQLKQSGFADNLEQHLLNAAISPDKIELIIKDSKNWHKGVTSKTNLDKLRMMNCQLSLSNFGSTETSITWLKENILSSVKISQQLIGDLENSKANQEVVKGLIHIANNMNLNCLANGVQTEFQANWLKENGCHSATGHLFSQPVNAKGFIEMIKHWSPRDISW